MPAALHATLPAHLAASLALAAAREALRDLSRYDHERIANEVLDAGVYDPAMAELAGFCLEPPRDSGALFVEGLSALGVAVPEQEAATERLVRHHLTELAQGRGDAWEEMGAVVQIVGACGCYEYAHDYDTDRHGLTELLRLYSRVCYGFGPDGPFRRWAYRRRLRRLARAWLSAHPAPPPQHAGATSRFEPGSQRLHLPVSKHRALSSAG